MPLLLKHLDTLRGDNEFSFGCPIFGSQVEARDCFALHSDHMLGRMHSERKACHACIGASKCPVRHMLVELDGAEGRVERYYSKTPVQGRLSAEVLERIGPIVVPDFLLKRFNVEGEERQAILDSVQEGKAPAGRQRKSITRTKIDRSKPTEKLEDVMAAAIDVAGAVTKAVEEEAGAEPAKPKTWNEVIQETIAPVPAPTITLENDSTIRFAGAPPPAPAPAAQIKPGMSLLDIARRMREKQS